MVVVGQHLSFSPYLSSLNFEESFKVSLCQVCVCVCVGGRGGGGGDALTPLSIVHVCNTTTDPAIWSHLQRRFGRDEDSDIRDVLDGDEYRKHSSFLSEPGNVTLLLNTDGVSMFKSSTISLWPIWLAINELPPHIR